MFNEIPYFSLPDIIANNSTYLPTKTSCVAKLEGHLNAQVVSSALKPWRDHPPNSTTCSNFLQSVFQVYATHMSAVGK